MNANTANGTDAGIRPAGAPFAGSSAAMALRGMAATSHALATEVAVDVLRRGGSAIDAAIGANAMLGFAEPFMCGPGGDLFAIVWDPKSRRLHGLNGSGRSPRSLSHRGLIAALGAGARQMPLYGPLSVTVPGAVDAWFMLHAKFGRLPMADVLGPVIEYAREGVPTPEIIAAEWQGLAELHAQLPVPARLLDNYRAAFLAQGRAPAAGEIFRNEPLAALYERLAAEGRDGFYQGETAAAIAACVGRVGGHLTAEDLSAHEGTWVDPVSTRYRGHDVYELPPNGQGIAALQMLNIVEGFDLAGMGRGSADYWHVMLEAKKLAFEDRARHYADPDCMTMPVDWLISKDYAAAQRELIALDRTLDLVEPIKQLMAGSDTVYLAAADRDGMIVSLIQSIYTGFGSTLVPDGLGFALQSRGAGFALEPGHPNVYAPGKRPFHTIIPGFVMRGGEPLMAFGVMGGDMQPQGHAQVLVNMIDFGMGLQAAGDAARFRHDGSSGPGHVMTDGGHAFVEPGIPAEVVAGLANRGHRIELARAGFGGYQAVARDPVTGVLTGATEMRKDGRAAGF